MSELVKIKLNVTPAEIVKILKNHAGCVGKNNAMPITDNVLIVVDEESMCFVTTNGYNFVRTIIPNYGGKAATVLVPFKKLAEILGLLSNQPLIVTINTEDYRIKIKAMEGSYEIAGENPTDFPTFPESDAKDKKTEWFSASGPAFKTALDNVLYAVSKDELKPQMTGVFIEANGSVTMTATDGNMIAHSKIFEEFKVNRENNEIVTASILNAVLIAIPNENEVTVYSNSRHQWIVMGNVELCARKLNERYPDWRNAVPKEYNTVKIDRRNLLASITRMLLFTDEGDTLVKSEIKGKSIFLTADSLNYDHHGEENLTLESESKIELEIGFNASQLKEALKHIEQELIIVEYSTPKKPIVLRYENGFSLLVPLTLSSNA